MSDHEEEPVFSSATEEATYWKGEAARYKAAAEQMQASAGPKDTTGDALLEEVSQLKLEIGKLRASASAFPQTTLDKNVNTQSSTTSTWTSPPQGTSYGMLTMPASSINPMASDPWAQFSQSGQSGPRMTSSSGITDNTATVPVTAWGAIPKLIAFSGDTDKESYPYRRWRFDVTRLLQAGYPDRTVGMAIVRSCRGSAADVLQTLSENFTTQDVLTAFDRRFGSVETTESVLSAFYSAHQKSNETVNAWGCRLESWLAKSQLQHMPPIQKASMLRERFWRGLHAHIIRNALRHRFDIGASYEDLLVQAREVETEISKDKSDKTASSSDKSITSAKTSSQAKAAVHTVKPDMQAQLTEILTRLTALEGRLPRQTTGTKHSGNPSKKSQSKGYHKKQASHSQSTNSPKKCYNCGMEGHYKRDCPQLNYN